MRDPKRRPWASLHEANDLHPPPLVEGAHPCVGCAAACCWVVQLQRSVPETIIELEFIKYVLGFRSIEVGIDSKGTWIVNYRAPCRHLTPEMRCELHGTPDKPLVCQRYDEHNCMYREAFLGGHKASYLRLDLRRFEILQGMLTFDGAGMVADTPTREEMLRAFTEVEARGPEPASDPWPPEGMLVPLKRLERNVRWSRETGRPTGELPHVAKQALTYAEAAETPCSRCAAPCCQLLVFDFGTPQHVTSVDFMEYMLGFPGLELALTTGGWKTLVHTECQHFDEETALCKVWGRPERPLTCSDYSAHKCAYKGWLMEPQTLPFLRVDHDLFHVVRRHFAFGDDGEVLLQLSVDQLRAVIDVVRPQKPGGGVH